MSSNHSGETAIVDRRDAFHKLAAREIDLLNQRTNMFLVYNSILLAGLDLGELSEELKLVVMLSGLLSTSIWLYLGHRGIFLEEFAWKKGMNL